MSALAQSLVELAVTAAKRHPDSELIDGSRTITFADLPLRSAALAGGLSELGLRAGDRVAIRMKNRLEWIDTWFAVARLGATIVPLNTRLSPTETEFQLRHSRSRWLVWAPSEDPLREEIEAMAARTGLRSIAVDGGSALASASLAELYSEVASPIAEDPDALGMIQYTSGSTSRPKGAMLRNRALIRNGYGMGAAWRLGPRDRVLGVNPLFHCGGTVSVFMSSVTNGASITFMRDWDPLVAATMIESAGITVFPGVDTTIRDLISAVRQRRRSCSGLRLVTTAADRPLYEECMEMFGCETSNVYGLTECSPNVCIGDLADPLERRLGWVGRPQPGIEVQIRDPDTGAEMPSLSLGEIVVRGWGVTAGYVDDPVATAASVTADGFFRTGDLGRLDVDGYLRFEGRLKLMMKSGGENVSIEEVETVLRLHPEIDDAVVTPIPDRRFGEVGLAFVVSRPGAVLSEGGVRAFVGERLARFKAPKRVIQINEIPRTGSAKVDRVALAARARGLASPVPFE